MNVAMHIWFVTQLLPKIGNPKSVGFPGKPPIQQYPQPPRTISWGAKDGK